MSGRPLRMVLALLICMQIAPRLPAEDPAPAATGENPYLAAADLSIGELVEFLDRMQRKPATLRERPGFDEALLDAAGRVLAAQPTEKQQTVALLVKFDVLSRQALAGSPAAYDELVKLSRQHKDDQRPRVAAHVQLCLLEQRAATANELMPEELSKLLADLKSYFAAQPLTQRHLRLASGTIRAINMLPKAEERNPYFTEFGKLFAKSSDRKLARYGLDLSKTPGGKKSDLVGQHLELEGANVDGLPFDWAGYRGKVVLVDFWATWCGPCRAELPNLKRCYETYHERGFEVVAISLDQDLDTLKNFLAEEQITWTNLFDSNSAGWDNPLATRYGVKAIPTCLLVDRQGKVISAAARGAELDRLLAELLGEK